MKKAIGFIWNLACGCLCALAAGLWFSDALFVLIEDKEDKN